MKAILNVVLAMFLLALVGGMATAASVTVVSGADAEYKDGDAWYNAVPLTYIHPEWTSRIPGASLPGAVWMWKTDGVTPEEAQFGSEVLFKHEFNVGCAENFAGIIQITTDNAFTLRVNNDVIASDADWTSLETYDISGSLKTGDNTIVIEAVNEPYATQDPQVNPAGVIYKADITFDEKACSNDVVVTPEVPEFGVVAAAAALIGALALFLYKRK